MVTTISSPSSKSLPLPGNKFLYISSSCTIVHSTRNRIKSRTSLRKRIMVRTALCLDAFCRNSGAVIRGLAAPDFQCPHRAFDNAGSQISRSSYNDHQEHESSSRKSNVYALSEKIDLQSHPFRVKLDRGFGRYILRTRTRRNLRHLGSIFIRPQSHPEREQARFIHKRTSRILPKFRPISVPLLRDINISIIIPTY